MTTRLLPSSEPDVIAAVTDAVAAKHPLEVVGQGSRAGLGAPVEAQTVLDLSQLRGVIVYEPEELILTVKAGTLLAEIEAVLASHRQHLAFEPPDFRALWNLPASRGTIGGAVAAGLGGSRRFAAGGPRDHVLGFKAVNGFGEPFAAGGRVVKNVTGFDLPKLMTGAFGTLGVLTEITLKVLPVPEQTVTLCYTGLEESDALSLLRRAAANPIPVSGLAHIPADVAARVDLLPSGASATLLRIEGLAQVADEAVRRLTETLRSAVVPVTLDPVHSTGLWRAIGGAALFAGSAAPVWRIAAPPARAAALGQAFRGAGAASLYYDWAGGLVWVEASDDETGGATALRETLARVAGEGHATLIRGSASLRRRIAPFQPARAGVGALAARIKAQFDPLGVFNPGRMGAG